MENRSSGLLASPSTRVLLKVVAYYAVLIGIGWLIINDLPKTSNFGGFAFQPAFDDAMAPASRA